MKWSESKIKQWYNKLPWMVGCNFVPSTAVNSTEMWQSCTYDEKTIQVELEWAKQIGFNTIRVFLQYVVWKDEGQKYIDRIDSFLDIANALEIAVMPILFDDCAFDHEQQPFIGIQQEPVPGYKI